MYGLHLLRLAELVGVRQIDIARHLGIVKVQPHYWASGKAPIGAERVAPLVALIAKAVKKRLATVLPGETMQAELTGLLRDCVAENCYREGHTAAPSLEAFAAKVEAYAALSRPQQQQASSLEDMERLTAAMQFWFELQEALLPLLALLPDEQPVPEPAPAQYGGVKPQNRKRQKV